MFEEFITFAKAAIKNPMEVSTVFPTSRYLANSLLDQVDFTLGKEFLELGAGSGAITKYVSRRINQTQKYLGVEISKDMVQFLRKTFPDMQFKTSSADSVTDFIDEGTIDGIISSLPWTLFPQDLQQNIVDEIIKILSPNGVFTTYVCANSLVYPGAKRFFSIAKKEFPHFKRVKLEIKNIPPAIVFVGSKKAIL